MPLTDPYQFTFPPPEPYTVPKFLSKPLLPLLTPHICTYPPARALSSASRKSLLHERYTLSAHIFPGATPRTTPIVPLPDPPKWTSDKDTYKAAVRRVAEELAVYKAKQYNGELDALLRDERQWWVAVDRYVRKGIRSSEGKGVTLICLPAAGFSKEVGVIIARVLCLGADIQRMGQIWEPTLHYLVSQFSASANYQVDEIWTWDPANHGDSALINRDLFTGLSACRQRRMLTLSRRRYFIFLHVVDWRDNPRDLLQFLKFYLPSEVSLDSIPTHLSRLPEAELASRDAHGLDRNIVFVGHSFGGYSM